MNLELRTSDVSSIKLSSLSVISMATPFKRICLRAARSRVVQRHQIQQWQTMRSLSSSPWRLAENELPVNPSNVEAPESHPPIEHRPSNPESTPQSTSSEVYNAPEDNGQLSGVRYDFEEKKEDISRIDESSMSALAYRELEQHRELREMVRLAAWEMPLLAQYSKPFEPPKQEQILKWRYTTYMGETHPAERKVAVEFEPARIADLSEQQLHKLLKLAGPRYNPATKAIKMSSDAFETQAQNKRQLADTINALIAEAKDPNADSFEDIPLDLRHHKPRPSYKFPDAWIMTPERKAQLEAKRKAKMLEEGKKVEEDKLVSGIRAIEEARKIDAEKVEEPVMARARERLPAGKMGKKEFNVKV